METKQDYRDSLKVEIIPTEGFSPGMATAITSVVAFGTGMVSAATTGAALGSIIPGLGTLAGGLAGTAAAYFAGDKAEKFISDKIAPTYYQAEWKDEVNFIEAFRIAEDPDEGALPAGKYKFAVHSQNPWECRLFQPDLNQSLGDLVQNWQRPLTYHEPGIYTFGPHKAGTKPVIAHAIKEGKGGLICAAYSSDSLHQTQVCQGQGQFYQAELRPELQSNKEYFIFVYSDGPWQIWCEEGY